MTVGAAPPRLADHCKSQGVLLPGPRIERTAVLSPVRPQVQLLISSQDVENYKLIKADLDRLRTLVEKSELWVEKKNSGGDGKKEKKDKKEKEEVGKLLVFTYLTDIHSVSLTV